MNLSTSRGSLVDSRPSTSAPAPLPYLPQRRFPSFRQETRLQTLAPDKSHLSSTAGWDIEVARRNLASQLGYSSTSSSHEQPSAVASRVGWLTPARDIKPSIPSSSEYHPSEGWQRQPHHPTREELWQKLRMEAQQDAIEEPTLASFLYSTILAHNSLEKTMAFLLGNKLANPSVLGAVQLMRLFQDAYEDEPDILEAGVADMLAVKDRDPACSKYTQCMLYFKGYHAIQTHRISNWLWRNGRKTLAHALQSRISEVFHVDIHPAATVGRGVMLDHATGIVIGETAVLGDNVSMLHHVTLGGSGTIHGVRHPRIGHGVLLGAGVSVLGPVEVGAGSIVGAGSVVVGNIPSHSVAVGVPARIIRRNLPKEPVESMDQITDFILDYVI